MYEDEPQDRVHDVLAEAIFGDHPLGRRVLGRAEVIGSIPVPDIAAYHDARYTAENIVVAAAGHVEHDADRRARRARCSPPAGRRRRAERAPSRARASRGCASTRRRPSSTTSASAGPASRAATSAASRSASSTRSSAARPPRGCSARCARSAASPTRSAPTPSSTSTAAWSPSTSAPARTTSSEACEIIGRELARCAPRASPTRSSSAPRSTSRAGMVLGLESTAARMARIARGDPLRRAAAVARRDARPGRRGRRRRGRRAGRRALRPGRLSAACVGPDEEPLPRAAVGAASARRWSAGGDPGRRLRRRGAHGGDRLRGGRGRRRTWSSPGAADPALGRRWPRRSTAPTSWSTSRTPEAALENVRACVEAGRARRGRDHRLRPRRAARERARRRRRRGERASSPPTSRSGRC